MENETFENTTNNEYILVESNNDDILLNIDDKVSQIYNSVLITTMIILSFSLYMFFHNITKRKEI